MSNTARSHGRAPVGLSAAGRIGRIVGMLAPGCDDPHRLIDWNPRQALRAVDPAVAGKRLALFVFEALQIVLRRFLQRGLGKVMSRSRAGRRRDGRSEIEKQTSHRDRNKAEETRHRVITVPVATSGGCGMARLPISSFGMGDPPAAAPRPLRSEAKRTPESATPAQLAATTAA